jgi:hypothetical protein
MLHHPIGWPEISRKVTRHSLMGWVRAQRRSAAVVALLALLLQLALAFGHVHGLRVGEPAAVAAAVTTGGASGSTQPGRDHQHDDYCAVCAVQALLGGATVAAPPALALPVASPSVGVASAPVAIRVAFQQTAFHSRAPPLS